MNQQKIDYLKDICELSRDETTEALELLIELYEGGAGYISDNLKIAIETELQENYYWYKENTVIREETKTVIKEYKERTLEYL